ncbi:hypothetical protein A2U01_0035848, partial [Trifolium medium]|nr:hypothetical protein [Trifolium medium]
DSKKNLGFLSNCDWGVFGDKFIAIINQSSRIEERFLKLKIKEGFLQSKEQVEVWDQLGIDHCEIKIKDSKTLKV